MAANENRHCRVHTHALMVGSLLAASAFTAPKALAANCADLTGLQISNTTITTAEVVPAGSYSPPDGSATLTGLPEFCRVAGVIQPTSDSNIKFEVWMPTSGWNGKYNGTGNGGLAGAIVYSALASGLRHGYATSNTDTGHDNTNGPGAFALGHPEKVIDFGYRAVHLTAVESKAVVKAFYDQDPTRSYYIGCSQGGQEGMMEAQRFPYDYDGIVVGDPDNYMTHHEVGAHLWATLALLADPTSALPLSKAQVLGSAVNAACDAQDGVSDGVLTDPRVCKFDPGVLLCQNGDAPDCLTAPQVDAVRKIYEGPDQNTYQGYYPGFERGGEAVSWNGYLTAASPSTTTLAHATLGLPFFKYFVFGDPNWDFHSWNWSTDVATVDAKLAKVLNAVNPNLSRFENHSGKLIHYHGFSDPDVPPRNSINYFSSVLKFISDRNQGDEESAKSQLDGFYRLFMAPGMGHCGGGPGPNAFGNSAALPVPQDPQHDVLNAIDAWVDRDVAPDQIIATKYTNDDPTQPVAQTRPLCPWPTVAQWDGSGDINAASSFHCGPQSAAEINAAGQ